MFNKAPAMIADEVNLGFVCVCVCVCKEMPQSDVIRHKLTKARVNFTSNLESFI